MPISDNFEVFKFIRIMLKLTGIWPKANATLSYKLNGLISFFFSAIFNALALTQIYYDFRGIESVSYSMFLNLAILFYLPKVLVFFYKRHEFYNILKYLNQPVLRTYDESLDFYMRRKIAIFTKLQIGFQILCCATLFVAGLVPFYGGDFKKELPIPFPFDVKNESVVIYGLLWILQFYILNLSALNNSSLDILACSFMAIASAQLEILREKFTRVADSPFESSANEDELKEKCTSEILLRLENCIDHHNAIELLIHSIDSTFTFMFLIQFTSSVCIICITLFTFILVPLASVQFGVSVLFVGCILTQLAIYCGFGNDVMVQSLRVGDSCYTSDWFNCETSVRKSLFIVMERSKRPYVLTAGKFITLSINSLIIVVKSSISYLAVLQTLYNKTKG